MIASTPQAGARYPAPSRPRAGRVRRSGDAGPDAPDTAPRADSRPDLAMIDRLRVGRFDAAAIFTVYSQNPLPSALLCYLADIPLRLAHCRETPYQVLTQWIPDPEPGRFVRHEVRRQ